MRSRNKCRRLPFGSAVTVKVPFRMGGASGAALNVRVVEVPIPDTGLGANAAVTPGGSPLAPNVISPWDPLNRLIGMVSVAEAAWATVK